MLNRGRIIKGVNSRWHARFGDTGESEGAKKEVDGVLSLLKKMQSLTLLQYSIILQTHGVSSNLIKAGFPTTATLSVQETNILRKWLMDNVWINFVGFLLLVVRQCLIEGVDGGGDCCICLCGAIQKASEEQEQKGLIMRWSGCGHVICERCFWKNILNTKDSLTKMRCPQCQAVHSLSELYAEEGESESDTMEAMSIEVRRFESLRKYKELPDKMPSHPKKFDKTNMVGGKKQQKKFVLMTDLMRLPACKISSTVGSYKEMRDERIWQCINDRYPIRNLKLIINHGVDINVRNEYNQTLLHVAAWYGLNDVADCLLNYGGCDPAPADWLNVTPWMVAKKNGNKKLCHLIAGANGDKGESGEWPHDFFRVADECEHSPKNTPRLERFFYEDEDKDEDESNDHPSSDACVIHDTLDARLLSALKAVVDDALPVSTCVKDKSSGIVCSDRKYFADTFNVLRGAIERSVDRAFGGRQCVVLPHFRVLDYSKPKTGLPPHVDLCRVDPFITDRKVRTTHTVILYLTDFDFGGETVLMRSLNLARLQDAREDAAADSAKVTAAADATAMPNDLKSVSIEAGKMLLFKHNTPHRANEVLRGGKCLLRGELYFITSEEKKSLLG